VKGDFSRIRFGRQLNFNGILPQQGKVLLDSDGIAQTLLENDWHETAARDIIGEIAGVPAAEPDSFEITAASLSGGVVTLTVGTGHIWADGLLVRLEHPPATSVTRAATWLEPPIVSTAGSAADVAAGTMDAVFLEVWQRAVNGYEIPDALIEPALGGPDAAERLQTSCAFRLARLAAGQTCSDVTFDESSRGALTVSLVPPIVTTGDCPVVGSGGYSGFEHQLYRIEVADIDSGPSQFKWSRVNGGLVGRGTFDPATQKIAITANLPAITSYRQTSFYLEIEAYDVALGYSRAIAGANATLSGSTLQCTAAPNFGAYPSTAGSVFFRLWDAISPVSTFPVSATPVQLENGIVLQFDPDGAGKYFPGDYWIFPVRAQGIPNPQVLINAKKPDGIVYYRVPLAEISWASAGGGGFSAGTIEDCRTIFHPLSNVKGCCTFRVGNGVDSIGDFTSIQAAVNALPPQGGEICILPGRYFEHVFIINRRDVVIHGCGWQTRVASPVPVIAVTGAAPAPPAPGGINPIAAVFTIVNSAHIELRSFSVEAADNEAGILVDGTGTSIATGPNIAVAAVVIQQRGVIDVAIEDLVINAATLPAILAVQVELLAIEHNRVAMKNVASLWPAIYTSGRELHIEHNWVGIQTASTIREWLPITVAGDLAGASTFSSSPTSTREFVDTLGLAYISVDIALHPGGIQIGGPSTDVYILENEIEGGSRNGITLGSYTILDANGGDTGIWTGVVIIIDGCCTVTLQPPDNPTQPPGGSIVAGGILVNIQIHRNRIRNMGLCGIGPVGFFDLATTLEIITIVGLKITSNGISRTLLRDLAPLTDKTKNFIGYGAICVPDVQGLTIYDNTITDFGAQPGVGVCGIFVLHGEMIDISRNQILETRDWNGAIKEATASTGARGGIVIILGTPPTFPQPLDSSLWGYTKASAVGTANATSAPIYEPGLPAVRVEHNVVRVPLNYALAILGIGPFSIVNNHLACGGLVQSAGTQIAQTVLILNLGTAIETVSASSRPSNVFTDAKGQYTGLASTPSSQNVSGGTVLFTDNMCHLEATASLQKEIASVVIVTPDSLIFSSNHCWLDSSRVSAILDALLVAGSLNVIGNRFQEALGSVLLSGLTAGKVNITGQNISTYCLIALGSLLSNNNNLALVSAANQDICGELQKRLQGELGL
jgi:hypothetical protein